ncbi:hypothetical protein V6Z11_A01G160100 [Gossypium hirsutum]
MWGLVYGGLNNCKSYDIICCCFSCKSRGIVFEIKGQKKTWVDRHNSNFSFSFSIPSDIWLPTVSPIGNFFPTTFSPLCLLFIYPCNYIIKFEIKECKSLSNSSFTLSI